MQLSILDVLVKKKQKFALILIEKTGAFPPKFLSVAG